MRFRGAAAVAAALGAALLLLGYAPPGGRAALTHSPGVARVWNSQSHSLSPNSLDIHNQRRRSSFGVRVKMKRAPDLKAKEEVKTVRFLSKEWQKQMGMSDPIKLKPGMEVPPGRCDGPLDILIETVDFLNNPNFAKNRIQSNGPIFRTNIGARPTIVIHGPEANEFVLQTEDSKFEWKRGWPPTFPELLGTEGLIFTDGEKHDILRRLLLPAFKGPALEIYFENIRDIADKYLERWNSVGGGEIQFLQESKRLTFEVAAALMMGYDSKKPGAEEEINDLSEKFGILADGLISPFAMTIGDFPGSPWRKVLDARDSLLKNIEETILFRLGQAENYKAEPEKTVDEINQNNPEDDPFYATAAYGRDVLGILLGSRDDQGRAFTVDQLKSQILPLMFGGHETTSVLLCTAIMAVSEDGEIMRKAKEEQQRLVDSNAGSTEVTMDQLDSMPYMDAILSESMRLYPPASYSFRFITEDTTFKNYDLPAGYWVWVSIVEGHLDPKIFKNPEKFEPERFLEGRDEREANRFAFIPFGAGPRKCIGAALSLMEAKTVMASLLRRASWDGVAGQDLSYTPLPSGHPKDGYRVTNFRAT
eukprot:CAMPEP_0197514838 /NCGR_PEP_ID=MMETSP1318-20131121/152_1 /TAXON_ID=552666 /ORGANISM="Partenskyella glossopodia, Strain RCC365" /LENGTH=589 /DNA_ID=CAMNT_0043063041 /DNA_START=42 /DNA_END=1811 /DNA_ORIENTATION=+